MTDELRPQRRGRRIAMTDDERDAFLAEQRTCRVATVGPDGPHATPLWFCWTGGYLWLYSITRSQRWADLMRDGRIGIVVDDGVEFLELHGVEINGTAETFGEIPRTGAENADLVPIEAEFGRKYFGGADMFHDQRHAWLRVTPTKISSWDFRKLSAL